MATDEATSLDIAVVRTLRFPKFWTADPQLWFAQVESQFTTSHITSQAQRFHHVVAALPPETAVDFRDIILEPPTTNPYNTLKAELIKRTSASEHRRLQQLLTSEELGDRTPSQLLRRLQQLLGERAATFDPALLRELFLQRLPNNVRIVLTSASGLALSLHRKSLLLRPCNHICSVHRQTSLLLKQRRVLFARISNKRSRPSPSK
ncbi:hypothetical protein HPB47_027984 [Ixodes persulcatus]|uniref:Uncharacterized protein n=1 Tax=Ixodes persulcatus TaxID=34615 RepID=A0AC60PUN7_IXOPE|nr:hypothetical protein HPB47_027984 [Ixodes persulcatus]